MQIKVEQPIKIDDGVHYGVIKQITYRDEPFKYVDVHIEMKHPSNNNKADIILRAGYPAVLSIGSKLGRLLQRFNFVLEPEGSIDPDSIKGKSVEFMTLSEQTPKGTFAKVIPDSVKPVAEAITPNGVKVPEEKVNGN